MLPGGEQRRSSQLALDAVQQALEGLDDSGPLAVVGANTSADMRPAEEAWRTLLQEGAPARPLDLIWPQLCHLPTQLVARALGSSGPRMSLSTACTSGASAVGVAADLVAAGRAPAAVAFGCDALCDTTVHGFGSLGLYDPEICRPFHPERAGLNLGEGAGALLLEPLDRALERGVRPLALLGGYGNASDAYRLTAPHPEGRGAVAAIRAALGDFPAERVGYVCAHGTGTPLNDAMEGAVLAAELPRAVVSGIKGAVGHTLGAAGALEAIVAVLAVARGRLPAHVGCAGADGVDLVQRARSSAIEAALSVNFAFGGNNTALLVTRWSP